MRTAENQYKFLIPEKNFYFILLSSTAESENEIEEILTTESDTKIFPIDAKDKAYFANNLREACLPKMLCEIAAKPFDTITEKEKSLLDLIK